MKSKLLISLSLLLLLPFASFAQEGRILTPMQVNPSVRSVGMGNVMLGNTDEMYLYVNPSAFIYSTDDLSVDFSSELYPDSDNGRLRQYNLATAYKLGLHQAIFVGGRYFGGLTFPSTLAKGDIKPYQWTVDLGYAFEVTSELVAYASASYYQDYIGTKADGLAVSAGLSYQKAFKLGCKSTVLTLGLRALDFGKAVKFDDTKLPVDPPSSVVLGGDWRIDLSKKHSLTYGLSSRFFTSKGAKETYVGTGLEYSYARLISLRAGYEYAKNSPNRLTFGLGSTYKSVKFNVAYGHTFDDYGVDTFLLGLGFSL